MTYAEETKWLKAKLVFDRAQPMGQFHVSGNELLWTACWPTQGGYCGYSYCVAILPIYP